MTIDYVLPEISDDRLNDHCANVLTLTCYSKKISHRNPKCFLFRYWNSSTNNHDLVHKLNKNVSLTKEYLSEYSITSFDKHKRRIRWQVILYGMHKSILLDAGVLRTWHTRISYFFGIVCIEVLCQKCSLDDRCCQIVNCTEHVVHFLSVHFSWADKEQFQCEKNCSPLFLQLESLVGKGAMSSQCKRPAGIWK